MPDLKDIVCNSGDRTSELVAETCAREGATAVVQAVDDRRTAIWALRTLSLASARKHLTAAALRLEVARNVITLSSIFHERVAVPEVIAKLRTSSDWLVRWTLVSWLNTWPDGELAVEVMRELTADASPWIVEEARHLLAILERERAEDARMPDLPPNAGSRTGVVVVVRCRGVGHSAMGDDPPRAFGDLTELFVESWPDGKHDYTLEELRCFIEDRRGAASR